MSHLTLIEPVPSTDKILEKESGVRFVVDARGVTSRYDQRRQHPYQENKASYMEKGSSLILTIVKKLVELLDGEIKVESTLGKGTIFKIYLCLERLLS